MYVGVCHFVAAEYDYFTAHVFYPQFRVEADEIFCKLSGVEYGVYQFVEPAVSFFVVFVAHVSPEKVDGKEFRRMRVEK